MKTLLHIPHASLAVPQIFYSGLLISEEEFCRYNREMSDIGVEELFRDVEGERNIAPYSRLFCDVERYREDEKEPMAKYGEGVVYTHLYDGTEFHDAAYRDEVLRYYDAYHAKFNEAVSKLLAGDRELLILDCHSFSDKMASHFFAPPFPDVCIGIEKDHYDEGIVSKILSAIERKGYRYAINYPYSGSIVPSAATSLSAEKRIILVMIEVNKRVYL